MNTFANIPEWVSLTCLLMLAIALLLALFRLIKGPTMPDRIVALDLIAALCMGFAIIYAITTSQVRYLDITAIVALVVFIGTVAFATYLKKKYYD
jgi:multicomponent Na+:H+ antiporter subunit F